MAGEEPKIIIDSDWKAQAQAEKEKLAQKAAAKAPASGGPARQGQPGQDEPTSFDELVRMLAMQALTFLGEIPDPASGQRLFAPDYARRYIDMLTLLEEKTKGNLSSQEQESLTAVAADLRMAYLEMTKAVAKAVAEGRIKPMAKGGQEGPGIAPAGGQSPLIQP